MAPLGRGVEVLAKQIGGMMSAVPFDTQRFFGRLREAGMPEEHARARVYATVDAINEMKGNKAAVAKTELTQPLSETRWEPIKWASWIMLGQTLLLLMLLPMFMGHR